MTTHSSDNIYLEKNTYITAVTPEDFPSVLDVLETAFPDISRTFFYSLTFCDPWFQPHHCLAVKREEKIVSYLQLFDRSLIFGDKVIRFGGIGSVGTRPECRGRGYAEALIRQALNIMKRDGMQGSLLYTTIQPFYQRFGWQIIPNNEQIVSVSALKPLKPHAISSRRLHEDDFPSLHEIYTQRQTVLSGALIRNLSYWQARPQWMNHTPVIVLDQNRMAAYFYAAKYNLHEPVLTITEYGYHETDDAIIALLLGIMARKAEEMACTKIKSFFYPDSWMKTFLDAHGLVEEEKPYDYMMWSDVGNQPIQAALFEAAEQGRFLYWQTDAF